MFNLTIFLGIQSDVSFEKQLRQTNPHLVALLTSGGDYLQEIHFQEQRYFGKAAPSQATFSELEYLEANVLSLLKKIAADYPFDYNPLRLLALHGK